MHADSVPPPPPASPSAVSAQAQVDLNKASWALGLGIASLLGFGAFAGVPGLILGWPLMRHSPHPETQSRAQIGVILSCAGIALTLLVAALAAALFCAMLAPLSVLR